MYCSVFIGINPVLLTQTKYWQPMKHNLLLLHKHSTNNPDAPRSLEMVEWQLGVEGVGHHCQHIRHRHHRADRSLQDLPGAPWLHHGPNLGAHHHWACQC